MRPSTHLRLPVLLLGCLLLLTPPLVATLLRTNEEVGPAAAEPGPAQDAGAQAAQPEEAVTTETAEEPVPWVRYIRDSRLAHRVVVRGSSLPRKELRANLHDLRRAVRGLENAGHRIGIVIRDLDTHAMITYGAGEIFYPASTIKGPYVVACYAQLVDTGALDAAQADALAQAIIVNSDNDAYRSLQLLCTGEPIARWAVASGAVKEGSAEYDEFVSQFYPWLTPRQLSRLWEQAHGYLFGGGASADKLLDWFDQRVESPLRAGLDAGQRTIAKAGWYPADSGPEFAATNDAGILIEGDHRYVVVIMTDLPDDLDALASLVPRILSARLVLD